jgi:predicted Fe-Mo cluster-binding NifX family protein
MFSRHPRIGCMNREEEMEKIAVSSDAPGLDSDLDPRFGRAAGFVVVDPDSTETQYIDNGASQVMAQGAGIKAAEVVVRAGVKIVLTGYVGPKAFQALAAAGVRVGQNLENMTVRQALEKFKAGEIAIATQPNRKGHWK